MAEKEKLLELKNVVYSFHTYGGEVKAVRDVSFEVRKGEILGIVGESGCGKTTVGRSLLRLYTPTSGDVFFDGERVDKNSIGHMRKEMQMVFQDPYSSLNPRMTVEDIIGEPLDVHKLYSGKGERRDRILELMELVGLNAEHATRYAHEFSGGQRQRIGIARALVMEPEFIVADEPISALDVSIRAQVLNLLNSMKKSRGLTYLFIAHDLSVVRFISDRIAVISKGRIVELAEAEELFLHPLHPYTKALLSAVPIPDPGLEKKKKLLVYDPSIHDYSVDKPVWEEIANGHFVYGNQKELEGYRKEYQSQL